MGVFSKIVENNSAEQNLVPVIQLKNICKTFGDGFKLFDNFNLVIDDIPNAAQRISIIGESGTGKSQLLKIISKINKPDSGEVLVYGRSDYQSIPMVFQQYSSYPWMTVLENVALPLKLQGISKKQREKQALEMLQLVGLESQANKWAKMPELSGGQLQRVSIARSLVGNNQILLMDEATSALDVKSKRDIEDALLNICNNSKLDPTIINVTHDISEAVYFSNRIYILRANPCRIYKIMNVSFGEDDIRNQDIRNTPEFAKYVSEAEQALNEIIE